MIRTLSYSRALIHLIIGVTCIVCIYPFLVVLGTSFQSQSDIILRGYSIIPKNFDFTAYKMILRSPDILLNSYMITIITSLAGACAGLWVITTYAYVISRKSYKYRTHLSFYAFFTMLFNGGIVPTYILMVNWLDLKNSILALILPYLINGWYVILMKGFLQSIPEALIESAKIDGAGELYIFVKIVLPISKPPLASIGLFLLLQYWNDWWLTLLYIDTDQLIKLQYLLIRVMKSMEFLNTPEALQFGLVKEGMEVPTLAARMAMCVLAAGPMLLVFPFFQRYFVKGLTVGSVKG
ncbi:carbohydrate ABC transporter permease [Paenibacillus sp. J5C_2022]|uniref:carbohydrate ABC transporter permease n=1 Tax=Paenibacillus sp. J5C2022 TaxID=2977129 RepID=UPI0021CF7210|nr:carbohydrate ABC transporter permease [Paenibacillus sp. J5C2022]MCU6712477.1 carbohydrate ABC transporter permease [Paenibacillus sp. J5C2022]